MSIYRYTLFKYFKAPSTWIVLTFVVFGIGFLLGGVIPFVFIQAIPGAQERSYVRAVIGTVSGVTIFMSVFSSVFAGFKSATMYRDEIENGTFLIVLSKPITRSAIIFNKWLALTTVVFFYSFISVLFYCISVTIFDTGYSIQTLLDLGILPISSDIFYVGIFIFIIVFISGMIFSSIGILISSRLSVAATIGILIALGLFIPVTSLLNNFLRKDAVYTFNNSSADIILAQANRSIDKTRASASGAITNYFNAASDPQNTSPQFISPEILRFINAAEVARVLESTIFPDLTDRVNNIRDFLKQKRINLIGGVTGSTDSYANLYFLDLNYQFSQMASFAFERIIPETYKEQLSNSGAAAVIAPQKISVAEVLKAEQFINDLNEFNVVYNQAASPLVQGAILNLLISLEIYRLQDFGDSILNNSQPEFPINLTRYQQVSQAIDSFISKDVTILAREPLLLQLKNEMNKSKVSLESSQEMLVTRIFLRDYFLFLFNLPLPEVIVSDLYLQITDLLRGGQAPIQFNFLDDLNSFNLGDITASNVTSLRGLLKKELISAMNDFLLPITKLKSYEKKSEVIYVTLNQLNYLTAPISYLLYFNSRIRSFSSEKGLIAYNSDQLRSLKLPALVVADDDLRIAENLATLASRDLLAKFSVSSYSNREAIIITYALLSIVLIPLTFPLIKRQDFR